MRFLDNKLTIAIIALFTVTLISCGEETTQNDQTGSKPEEQVESASSKEEQDKADLYDSEKILADKENLERVRQELKDSNPVLKEEFNTTSTYRYLTSTPEFSIIGELVHASDHARKLHSEQITFLAPNNDAFSSVSDSKIKKLLKPENKEILNSFVANHILQGLYYSEKVDKVEDEILNLNGDVMDFDGSGELMVNGIGVVRHDFKTKMGIIIPMKEPIDFPL